jgi:ABC-type transport system involved in multi-copper enzyme maturation permease subunit
MSTPGLARLTAVELRKMTDTRAGFWLQFVVVALTVALVVVFSIFAETKDLTYENMLLITVQPAGFLLPIVGILLVSSEWSQRTALITFTLVPKRGRVLVAKLLAAVVLALVAMAISVPVAALANAIAGGTWDVHGEIVWQLVIFLTTAIVMGVGFGAAILASAPAIVCYFALPISWSIVGSFKPFRGVADWLDGGQTLAPLTDHVMSSGEWQRALATLALWMVVPALIGAVRIIRGEIRVG